MKQILHKKQENQATKISSAFSWMRYDASNISFDGILRKEILMTLLDVKHVQKIYKTRFLGQPSRSPQGYSLYRRKRVTTLPSWVSLVLVNQLFSIF